MKNTFYFISTNWICYWQIRFCSYYAFSLNQMSDIHEVWKYWPLKDRFRLISQKFYRAKILHHFVVDEPENFKLLADFSFESSLQNIVLSSLLLFLCAAYWDDLDDIQRNEVAAMTARKFNNSWPYTSIFQIW